MKKLLLITLSLSLNYSTQAQSWNQIGTDLIGEAAANHFTQTSINADGSIVAIGALGSEGSGNVSGEVKVYQNTGGNWTQLGNDIEGPLQYSQFGCAVSINDAGNIVAIGAKSADLIDGGSTYTDIGCTYIYELNGTNWTLVGSPIFGEHSNDASGISIDLSSDGTTVAIGAHWNDDGGFNNGHARVYKNNGGLWAQVGADIDGSGTQSQFGYAVSLNSAGDILAVGANHSNQPFFAGQVKVYKNTANVWGQLGSDLDGNNGDQFGSSISLNDAGDILAIGAPWNDDAGANAGQVTVYENTGGNWTQKGGNIDGKFNESYFGQAICMDASGSTIVIGAYGSNFTGHPGFVSVYNYDNSIWAKKGNDTDGKDNGQFGYSVSLNNNGTIFSAGANVDTGLVRIYEFDPTLPPNSISEYTTELVNLYPNPTKDIVYFKDVTNIQNVKIIDTRGVVVLNIESSSNFIDVSKLSNGLYLILISAKDGYKSNRLIKN